MGSTPVLETRSSSSATQGLCWHKQDQNSPFCLPFSWITPSQTNCHLSLHTFNGTLHWCCLFFPLPSSPVTLLCANLFFQASVGSLNDDATAILLGFFKKKKGKRDFGELEAESDLPCNSGCRLNGPQSFEKCLLRRVLSVQSQASF